MKKHTIVGKTISLEIKTYKFEVKQKSITVSYWVETKEDLAKIGKQMLGLLWPCEPTRLMGLKVSHLSDKSEIQKESDSKLITDFAKPKNMNEVEKPNEPKVMEESKVVNACHELPKKRERSEKVEPPKHCPKRRGKRYTTGDNDTVKLSDMNNIMEFYLILLTVVD